MIKRYRPSTTTVEHNKQKFGKLIMETYKTGEYVKYTEYQKLLQEHQELQQELTDVKKAFAE